MGVPEHHLAFPCDTKLQALHRSECVSLLLIVWPPYTSGYS